MAPATIVELVLAIGFAAMLAATMPKPRRRGRIPFSRENENG